MKYLLVTQVLLWIFGESDKLTEAVTQIIKDQKNELRVSLVSIWEIAIKLSIGKLSLPFELEDLTQEILSNNISLLSIEVNHTLKVAIIPFHHKDPFDRLIISQAIIENLPVISSDDKFSAYDIERIW